MAEKFIWEIKWVDVLAIAILELLLNTLEDPEPNFAHLVLGFNIDRGSVKNSELM